MMMTKTWQRFKRLGRLLGLSEGPVRRSDRGTRLRLEWLEDRCVPADCYWIGQGMTGTWTNPANWYEGRVATGAPDTAIFGLESVKKPGIVRFQSPVLPAGGKELQLGGLKIYSTFDSTFGKHSLILDKALQVANLEVD